MIANQYEQLIYEHDAQLHNDVKSYIEQLPQLAPQKTKALFKDKYVKQDSWRILYEEMSALSTNPEAQQIVEAFNSGDRQAMLKILKENDKKTLELFIHSYPAIIFINRQLQESLTDMLFVAAGSNVRELINTNSLVVDYDLIHAAKDKETVDWLYKLQPNAIKVSHENRNIDVNFNPSLYKGRNTLADAVEKNDINLVWWEINDPRINLYDEISSCILHGSVEYCHILEYAVTKGYEQIVRALLGLNKIHFYNEYIFNALNFPTVLKLLLNDPRIKITSGLLLSLLLKAAADFLPEDTLLMIFQHPILKEVNPQRIPVFWEKAIQTNNSDFISKLLDIPHFITKLTPVDIEKIITIALWFGTVKIVNILLNNQYFINSELSLKNAINNKIEGNFPIITVKNNTLEVVKLILKDTRIIISPKDSETIFKLIF